MVGSSLLCANRFRWPRVRSLEGGGLADEGSFFGEFAPWRVLGALLRSPVLDGADG